METSVKHRIKQFIEYKGISVREFERVCGLSNGYVNGIYRVITTHVARHTYATYLINNGISIMTVSKALGHSNTKMSERYAKLLANTVIDELATLKTK